MVNPGPGLASASVGTRKAAIAKSSGAGRGGEYFPARSGLFVALYPEEVIVLGIIRSMIQATAGGIGSPRHSTED
jgi:hypothetical protein